MSNNDAAITMITENQKCKLALAEAAAAVVESVLRLIDALKVVDGGRLIGDSSGESPPVPPWPLAIARAESRSSCMPATVALAAKYSSAVCGTINASICTPINGASDGNSRTAIVANVSSPIRPLGATKNNLVYNTNRERERERDFNCIEYEAQ